MKHSRAILILFTLCTMAGCELTDALLRPFVDSFRPGYSRPPETPLHIAGTVIDEQGRELTGAVITAMIDNSPSTILNPDGAARFDAQITGRFSHLFVSCPGYYPRRYYPNGGTLAIAMEGRLNVGSRPQTPIDDARLLLRKQGTLTNLDHRIETLQVDAQGGGIVIAPSAPTLDFTSAQWVPNVEAPPPNSLYLTTSRTPQGIPAIAFRETCCRILKPAHIRLGITGQGNGLILYTPKSDDDAWFEMREAPASGYQSELTLGPDEINRFVENDRLFLYIKCNGRFGRCSLSDWSQGQHDQSTFSVYGMRITLEMQPDGTRNLEQNHDLLPSR